MPTQVLCAGLEQVNPARLGEAESNQTRSLNCMLESQALRSLYSSLLPPQYTQQLLMDGKLGLCLIKCILSDLNS